MIQTHMIRIQVKQHPAIENFRLDLLRWSELSELGLVSEYQQLITDEPESLARARVAGHFTASALLVDPRAGEVQLLMHPKVGRWLQFGGHIELTDESFANAALRECREESGYWEIEVLPIPAALDRHAVPCAGGQSVHWDVQFLAVVDNRSERTVTEDLSTRWWDLSSVTQVIPDLDPSVQRLISAAHAL
jgi:ADP-ribose pyrophosphatase YjhB (NUDIX family)